MGRRKCHFLIFSFSQISNDYCQKFHGRTIFFQNGFRGFLWASTTSQIFLIYMLLPVIRRPFLIFSKCFFVFSKRNITISILMIYFKCTFVYYANLNSSPINKLYMQAVEYSILFFSISYIFFNESFIKKLKKLSFFNTNFWNLF